MKRKAFTQRPEVLEDVEHESLLASRLRVGNLTAQDGEFLTKDEQLEILRARGSTREQEQTQHLAKGDQNETDSHDRSLAAMTTSGSEVTEMAGQGSDRSTTSFTSDSQPANDGRKPLAQSSESVGHYGELSTPKPL